MGLLAFHSDQGRLRSMVDESKHLSQPERKNCMEYLQSGGYLIIDYGQNSIAVVNGLFEIRGIVVNPV